MAESSRNPESRPRHHGWRIFFAAVALLGLAGWIVEMWAGRRFEAVLTQKLAERGLTLRYGGKTWSPWRGLHLRDAAISTSKGEPVAELGNIAVNMPPGRWFGQGPQVTNWYVRNADVTLYDEAGPVKLTAVSLDLDAGEGDLKIRSLHAWHGGLEASLTGDIWTGTGGGPPSSEPLHLRLNALRGTLAALKVQAKTGPLMIKGTFSVDTRSREIPWNAQMNGESGQVVWQDIRLESASIQAELTQAASKLSATLKGQHGETHFTITRQDWHESPFAFSGTYKDLAGNSDDFGGEYALKAKRLTVDQLSGSADLIEGMKDIPAMANQGVPDTLSFAKFPRLELSKLVRQPEGNATRWSVGSLKLDGEAVIRTKEGEVKVNDLAAAGAYEDGALRLKDLRGTVFGGNVDISGLWQNGRLSEAVLHGEDLKLSQVKAWLNGGKPSGKGQLTVDFRGSLEPGAKELNGRGSMQLEDAPVFDAPLLEQTYQLFDALFPGIQRAKEGRFDATFTSKSHLINVDHFEATGGSLTVNAKGTINLESQRVDGTARGKLTGVKGVVTSPLSRLLEMDVGGPFDDIRVKPMGPVKLASNAADATVGAATDTGKEALKITGTVLKEGVKLPFRIFAGKDRDEPGPSN